MARLDFPLVDGAPSWGTLAHPPLPPLRGQVRAEVAIVGAGLTGLALALELRWRGIEAVVLEADHVGSGSTPAATALMLWETDRDLHRLQEQEGRARASGVWRACLDMLDWWEGCCSRAHLGGFDRATSVYFAASPSDEAGLRREAAARREAGLPSRFEPDAAPWLGFHAPGAIVSEGAGTVNPVRLLSDLLEACLDEGIAVHEGTPIQSVRADRAAGPGVEMRARRVVVAAGLRSLEAFDLPPLVRQRVTYVAAYEADPAGWRADAIGWSTSRPYDYLRRDGPLALLGGQDLSPAQAMAQGDAPFDRLRQRWGALYPQSAEAPRRAQWAGLFPNSPDSLPFIGPLPGLGGADAVLAFGGNGMVFGLLGAWLLAGAIAGEGNEERLAPYAYGRLAEHGLPAP